MKKKAIFGILFSVLIALSTTFLEQGSTTAKGAIYKVMGIDESKMDKDFTLVKVKDSQYYLAIFKKPNRIYVFKDKNFLGIHHANMDVFNLYESPNKTYFDYDGNRIHFGTLSIPDGKIAKIKGKKIKHVFFLGDYYKDSKFALIYKDLYFFYLDKPVKVTMPTFDNITIE